MYYQNCLNYEKKDTILQVTIAFPMKQGETGASSVLITVLLILPPNSYSSLLSDHLRGGGSSCHLGKFHFFFNQHIFSFYN